MNRPARPLAAALSLAMAIALPGTANAQASPSPYTTGHRYDAMGRVTGVISPNSPAHRHSSFLATRTTYDASGRPTKVESGYLSAWQSELVAPASWSGFTVTSSTEVTYDAMGRKTTEAVREWVNGSHGALASLTQYSYDILGRLQCTAVRMNPAIYGSLPAACTMGTAGSHGPDRITRNFYDAAGQLLQVREGVGAGTSIEAAEVTYTYTSSGKIESVIDAGGNKARLCYDGHNRQSRWVFPSSTKPAAFNDSDWTNAVATAGSVNGDCTASPPTGSDYEEYGYDANGNRTSLRKRDGSILTYDYDALNRMTRKVVPDRDLPLPPLDSTHERDVYYSYDLRGLTTSARFDNANGEGVLFTFDGFGRKTTETVTMDGASRTIASHYDANSNRYRLTYPDNHYVDYYWDGLNRFHNAYLNGTSPLFMRIWDQAGRPSVDYRRNTASGAWGPGTGYTYNPASRLESISQSFTSASFNTATSFTYNPAPQIASSTRSNDLYAWNGAVAVNRPYVANGLNEYSAVAGTSFAYDANGNLTSDGTDTYTYDIENRMVGRVSGANTFQFRYDPLGRFYEYSLLTSGSLVPQRRYYYDGDALVLEYSIAGAVSQRYVHGAGAGDDPMVWFSGAGVADTARRYFYADERGSVIALTDGAGNVTNTLKYDEYGIPAVGNGSRFQYTGQAWHPAFGMYYYKARLYSPTLGRFMQTDPIGYEDQFNLYAYVGNDPINMADPGGADAIVVINEDSSIDITLPMTFTGDAATPQNIATAKVNIEQVWTGSFDGKTVRTTVVEGKVNGISNEMEIRSGPTDRVNDQGHIGHSQVRNGSKGVVTLMDVNGVAIPQPGGGISPPGSKGTDTFAHEGGHYMGAPDTGPVPGIMGRDGSSPTGADIDAITGSVDMASTITGAINDVDDRRRP